VEVLGVDYKKSEKGMTLLEALVSTAIIGIGFVAIFQMVQYSVRSIDVSGERTKATFLTGMVAEDLIAEKNSSSPTNEVKFMDYLISNRDQTASSWRMGSCSGGTTTSGTFNNAAQNKFKKWDDRFSTRRLKCKGGNSTQDIKFLKVYDICNNNASGNRCMYNNTQVYSGNTGIYEKWYLGKMEVNVSTGSDKPKKKYLYFQIH
tara:strand:- start:8706 stop:9317 length:612 start_codon:yes stop_codon:yes gene_type:complete